ncbi:OmpA family protein [Enterobacteriaceae bacterium H18W14]|uniref:OmpA family protein n=1 Tax=Dryocola boscaweniae TaxID=2925397 RepID=UPI0022F04564|nr:OmpA family protein [Dryocola boscaweniae]MCT4715758.1 OmpA family protein [Dryocola boscaweniae]
MVKSETIFSRLIGIDTLISFDGIIPSPADFQLKLTSLIERLHKELIAEDHTQEESETLCRTLCRYFDIRLTDRQQNNALSWQRYSLVHYFYGYNTSEDNLPLAAQIEPLLHANSKTLFRCARQLLTLLIQQEGQTEELLSLRAASHERYFSQEDAHSEPSEFEAVPQSEARTASPRLIVFIIGPFAGKWFNQNNLSTGNGNGIVWVIATHATSLAKRIAHVREQHTEAGILAFFPLLADGFEKNGILIEQIAAWQYALSSTRLPESLPCMLGLYTRLSLERSSHDPDQAIWSGNLTATPVSPSELETRLIGLLSTLKARDNSEDIHAIQRHALIGMLVSWLAENRIMSALQNLFDGTQLSLTDVAIADHGQGFTRHGAWSRWLAEKYGILPGLSGSIALPPLPSVQLPPLMTAESAQSPLPLPPIAPKPARRRWPKIAAILALLACLAGGAYVFSHTMLNLLTQRKSFGMFVRESEATKAKRYGLAGAAPLFKKGSSSLAPGSEEILKEIVSEIVHAPEQLFLIIGHSDNTGSEAVNRALSTERARIIRDWLVKHTGLPVDNFIIEGAGNSRPIANNDTQEGRAQNRRVEIIPLSTQGK